MRGCGESCSVRLAGALPSKTMKLQPNQALFLKAREESGGRVWLSSLFVASLARQTTTQVPPWLPSPLPRLRGSPRRSVVPSLPFPPPFFESACTPLSPPDELVADPTELSQAAKAAAKGESVSSKSSKAGSKTTTAATSAATSDDEGPVKSMKQLALDTDRSGSGVLSSDAQSRDIHIESYSLSFHGRLLIENAEFSLNYGQRYTYISSSCFFSF
jgi:hypothetical protein